MTAAPVCLHTLMSNNSHLKSRTKLHVPLYSFMSKNTRHPKYLNYNFEQQPKEIVKCPVQQHPPSPDLCLGDSIVWVLHGWAGMTPAQCFQTYLWNGSGLINDLPQFHHHFYNSVSFSVWAHFVLCN